MSFMRVVSLLLSLFGLGGLQSQGIVDDGAGHAAHHASAPDPAAAGKPLAPVLGGLGTWTFPVTTASPRAQQFFDQGLRLSYGFNHAEAIRAFREAARLDPTMAMAAWGVAFALGPNINAPLTADSQKEAYAAIQR